MTSSARLAEHLPVEPKRPLEGELIMKRSSARNRMQRLEGLMDRVGDEVIKVIDSARGRQVIEVDFARVQCLEHHPDSTQS